jgi:hypothetical protein
MLRRILYRSVDDPTEYLVAVDYRSRAAAEAAMRAEQVQQWLDRAGVTIYPPMPRSPASWATSPSVVFQRSKSSTG